MKYLNWAILGLIALIVVALSWGRGFLRPNASDSDTVTTIDSPILMEAPDDPGQATGVFPERLSSTESNSEQASPEAETLPPVPENTGRPQVSIEAPDRAQLRAALLAGAQANGIGTDEAHASVDAYFDLLNRGNLSMDEAASRLAADRGWGDVETAQFRAALQSAIGSLNANLNLDSWRECLRGRVEVLKPNDCTVSVLAQFEDQVVGAAGGPSLNKNQIGSMHKLETQATARAQSECKEPIATAARLMKLDLSNCL